MDVIIFSIICAPILIYVFRKIITSNFSDMKFDIPPDWIYDE